MILFQVRAFSNPFWPVRSAKGVAIIYLVMKNSKAALTINQCLLDILGRRHHKWTILVYFLFQWFTGNLELYKRQGMERFR